MIYFIDLQACITKEDLGDKKKSFYKMFTANLAGTSGSHGGGHGSHLRPDHHYRDSIGGGPSHNSSRINLGENGHHHHNHHHHHHHNGHRNGSSDGSSTHGEAVSPFAQGGMFNAYADSEEDVERGSAGAGGSGQQRPSMAISAAEPGKGQYARQRSRLCDVKAIAGLACMAGIVIGGIILIVLAALGKLRS